MVVFVVDGTQWTADDDMVLNKLRYMKCPVVLAVNKVDVIKDKEVLLPHLQMLAQKGNFAEILPISAEKGTNVDKIRDMAKRLLPEGQHYFPEDYITDRSSRFMASEIIREKLMRFTGEELPYSVTVEIERFKVEDVEIERFKVEEDGLFHINALILVEREGQKKMVIGNKGEKLKVIGTEARLDMERLFGQRVFLELWVKVKSGWADDERALRSLGYGDD
jgi:GTP-binding protein Era